MTATSTAPDATAPARGGFLRSGYPRSFGIGSTFAIAWSPCIGPILGVILTLAATTGSATQGALLLAFYAAGLGVWFLAFGLAFSWIAPKMREIQRYLPMLMVVSGALFIGVGALMVLGQFGQLNSYFQSFGFLFDQTASAEESLTGGTSGTAGPLIAFFGGMVSFLSPCVVPLVPVYLANRRARPRRARRARTGGGCSCTRWRSWWGSGWCSRSSGLRWGSWGTTCSSTSIRRRGWAGCSSSCSGCR